MERISNERLFAEQTAGVRGISKLYLPFDYPGSKAYAVKRILQLVPEHRTYIEPFCGGAALFFAKKKAEHNWLNDIDEELINVYATLRDDPELPATLLGSEGVSPSIYRRILHSKPRTEVARAAKWLYIALTSYPQTLNLKQNLHKFNEPARIDLSSATYKLRDVRLTSIDFENVINDAPNGAFLFIDPPYSIRNSKSKRNTYLHKFSDRDHLRLARALRDRCKEIKFMLFYKENSYVERLFSFDASVSKRMLVSQIVRQTMKGRKPVAIREPYKEMVFMNYGKSMAVEHSRK